MTLLLPALGSLGAFVWLADKQLCVCVGGGGGVPKC